MFNDMVLEKAEDHVVDVPWRYLMGLYKPTAAHAARRTAIQSRHEFAAGLRLRWPSEHLPEVIVAYLRDFGTTEEVIASMFEAMLRSE